MHNKILDGDRNGAKTKDCALKRSMGVVSAASETNPGISTFHALAGNKAWSANRVFSKRSHVFELKEMLTFRTRMLQQTEVTPVSLVGSSARKRTFINATLFLQEGHLRKIDFGLNSEKKDLEPMGEKHIILAAA